MQLIRYLLSNFLSQHVSGIIMPIIRENKTVSYCMWCSPWVCRLWLAVVLWSCVVSCVHTAHDVDRADLAQGREDSPASVTTTELHKTREFIWIAEKLLAVQEGLCSVLLTHFSWLTAEVRFSWSRSEEGPSATGTVLLSTMFACHWLQSIIMGHFCLQLVKGNPNICMTNVIFPNRYRGDKDTGALIYTA